MGKKQQKSKKLLVKAEKAFQKQDYEAAEQFYSILLKKKPNSLEILDRLVATSLKAAKTDKALSYLIRCERLSPGNAHRLNNIGVIFAGTHQPEKAELYFKKAEAADPSYIDTHFNLGLLYIDQSQHANAISCFQKALSIKPDHLKSHNLICKTLSELGQYSEAISALEKALSFFPENISLLDIYGFALYRTNNLEIARDTFIKITRLNPDFSKAYYNLGIIFKQTQDVREAEHYFKLALKHNPENASILNHMGTLRFSSGDTQTAITYFKAALASEEKNLDALFNLGLCYAKENLFEQATDIFRQVLSQDPEHFNAWYQAARTFRKANRYNEALVHIRNALRLNPDEANARNEYGVILYSMGDLNAAQTLFEELFEAYPKSASVCFNLGVVYKLQNKNHKAIQFLKQSIELGGPDENAEHELATLMGKTTEGMPEEFIRQLFDGYAGRFDHHLVSELKYRAPELIRDMLINCVGAGTRFENVLDLGCGTGLSGEAFKPIAGRITGVDLSDRMLEQARAKKVYDELHCKEVNRFLTQTSEVYDLFISLDVFIYMGNLDQCFANIRKCAASVSHLIFSIETCDSMAYELKRSGRYAQNHNYISRLCKQNGYTIAKRAPINLRLEKNNWIPGELYIVQLF